MFPLNSKQKAKLTKIAAGGGGYGMFLLDRVLSPLIGHGPFSVGEALSYTLSKKLFPLEKRIKLPDIMAESAAKQFAGELGKNLANVAAHGVSGLVGSALSSSGKAIIEQIKKTDPIIASADNKLLQSAYNTMASVAPTLSKDINAVRSFLREVAMSGTGPDYGTIKQLADAERTIKQSKGIGG